MSLSGEGIQSHFGNTSEQPFPIIVGDAFAQPVNIRDGKDMHLQAFVYAL